MYLSKYIPIGRENVRFVKETYVHELELTMVGLFQKSNIGLFCERDLRT